MVRKLSYARKYVGTTAVSQMIRESDFQTVEIIWIGMGW
jgi:hypothetical protein